MAENNMEASLLFECIRELSYVQDVCDCGRGKSGLGKELIGRGMKVLRISDLSQETLAQQRLYEHELVHGKRL